jgi:hypothetical protein
MLGIAFKATHCANGKQALVPVVLALRFSRVLRTSVALQAETQRTPPIITAN